MSDIRGLVIQSRLEYLEKIAGNDTYNLVLQQLSEPVRQAVGEQVFPTNLYPFHLLRDLDSAIGSSIEKPLETVFREIGNNYAIIILDRYFFNYVKSQNPQNFLAQMGNLYHYLWNFGKYTYEKVDNNSTKIKLDYDEDIHKPYCWFIQEFLKKGVELCGGKSVELTEMDCEAEDNKTCVYRLSWL